jgi:hypothetical protein
MDQKTTNLFTIIFSLYGAIVSTTSFLVALGSVYIAWLAYHRDNPKITVKVTNGLLLPPSIDEGIKIFINVINHGRRPVVITNTGFLLNNGSDFITFQPIGVSFPHELTEGQRCAVIYDLKEIIEATKEKSIRITHAWADDAKGKRHKTKYNIPKNN